MKQRVFILASLLLAICVCGHAAPRRNYNTAICTELVKRANACFKKGKYGDAKVLYEQALSTGDGYYTRLCRSQPGEDLASIARKYDISIDRLLEFNEVVSRDLIKAGDIVFLDKKKKKYEGSQDEYRVKPGDTLHKISQEYGIQLHQLAKLNNIYEYARLKEGTLICLK